MSKQALVADMWGGAPVRCSPHLGRQSGHKPCLLLESAILLLGDTGGLQAQVSCVAPAGHD